MKIQDISKEIFEFCKAGLREAIKASKYKAKYFYEGLRMEHHSFYERLRNNNWSISQLVALGYLLEGKEVPTEIVEHFPRKRGKKAGTAQIETSK